MSTVTNDQEDENSKAHSSSENETDGNPAIPALGSSKINSVGYAALQFVLLMGAMAIFFKGTIAEARYIPSSSMLPTLQINDRVLVEKITHPLLGRKYERGDIVVFYPPEIENGCPDNGLLGRFIPLLPENPPAFIKRVIGLPGDRIEIKRHVGVFVNGELLDESAYVKTQCNYNLKTLGDIGGYSRDGQPVMPFPHSGEPIVVPENEFFVLGDNRNASADSHVWGFAEQNRVVGRACCVFWKDAWIQNLCAKLPNPFKG
ncbi:MAG TPA: signal peptidase I [Oculatellaceae cyanobacterium]